MNKEQFKKVNKQTKEIRESLEFARICALDASNYTNYTASERDMREYDFIMHVKEMKRIIDDMLKDYNSARISSNF